MIKMAISVEDSEKQHLRNLQPAIRVLEKHIDEILINRQEFECAESDLLFFKNNDSFIGNKEFDINDFNEMNKSLIRKRILDDYQAGGWHVEWTIETKHEQTGHLFWRKMHVYTERILKISKKPIEK